MLLASNFEYVKALSSHIEIASLELKTLTLSDSKYLARYMSLL